MSRTQTSVASEASASTAAAAASAITEVASVHSTSVAAILIGVHVIEVMRIVVVNRSFDWRLEWGKGKEEKKCLLNWSFRHIAKKDCAKILPSSANPQSPSSIQCIAPPCRWFERYDLCFAVQCWRKSSNDIQFSAKRAKRRIFMRIKIKRKVKSCFCLSSFLFHSPKSGRNSIYFSFNHKKITWDCLFPLNFPSPFVRFVFEFPSKCNRTGSQEVTSVFLSSWLFRSLRIISPFFIRETFARVAMRNRAIRGHSWHRFEEFFLSFLCARQALKHESETLIVTFWIGLITLKYPSLFDINIDISYERNCRTKSTIFKPIFCASSQPFNSLTDLQSATKLNSCPFPFRPF